MEQSKGAKDYSEFIFTRPEMAKLLGISTNALRMRMRKGNVDNLEYTRINGNFKFKRPRADKVIRPGGRWPESQSLVPLMHEPSKASGRGSGIKHKGTRNKHHSARYPNNSFKQHNDLKIMARIRKQNDPEVLNMLPEAIEIAKQRKQERLRNNMLTAKNYGGFIRGAAPFIEKHSTGFKALEPKEKDEYEKALEEAEADSKYTGKYYW